MVHELVLRSTENVPNKVARIH